VVAVAVLASVLRADDRYDIDVDQDGAFSVQTFKCSEDGGVPHTTMSAGKDTLYSVIRTTAQNYNVYNGQSALKQRPTQRYNTPLAKTNIASADPVYCQDAESNWFLLGWRNQITGRRTWPACYRLVADGKYMVKSASFQITGHTDAAHEYTQYAPVFTTAEFPTVIWTTGAPPLATTFYEGGSFETEINGSGEEVAVVDDNGEPILEVVPAVALRLTSSVTYNGGSSVTYTYYLENLTDEDRDFSFPDIRTSTWTSGWFGTVAANDTETMQETLSGGSAQNLWVQETDATFTRDGESEPSLGDGARVYTPENMAAFIGSVAITSASYSSGTDSTTVTFQLSSDAAERAVLVRVHSGVSRVVADVSSTFEPGIGHALVDEDPPAGISAYYVRAGVRCNGYSSESEEVEK
jgi:hypothetical protein